MPQQPPAADAGTPTGARSPIEGHLAGDANTPPAAPSPEPGAMPAARPARKRRPAALKTEPWPVVAAAKGRAAKAKPAAPTEAPSQALARAKPQAAASTRPAAPTQAAGKAQAADKPKALAKPKPKPKATARPKAAVAPAGTPVAAGPARRQPATPAQVAPKPAKPAAPDAGAKTARQKDKLVRDSFTMPRADFALIQQLKDRAMGFKRATKKSELLRAGLRALAALPNAQLQALLNSLPLLKAGRPKKGG